MDSSIAYAARAVKKKHLLALILAGLIVYGGSLSGPFLWDDETLIVHNPDVTSVSPVRPFLHPVSSAFPSYYRPLQMLSYQVDFRIWGFNPFGFHLTNVLLHLANVLLLYGVMVFTAGDARAAFIAAVLFAVHPVMSEPVNYISSRQDLLMAFFLLISFMSFSQPGRLSVPVSLAAFAAALLSKESALVFVVVFLAWAVLSPRRVTAAVPHLVLAAAYCLGRLLWGGSSLGSPGVAFGRLLLTDLVILATYIKLLVLPVGLHKNWIIVLVDSVHDQRIVFALMLIALTVLACVAAARRRRDAVLIFGMIWFGAMLTPSLSGVILSLSARTQPFNTVISEAWLYTASAGFFLCVARLISGLSVPARRGVSACAVVLVCVLSAVTMRRNRVWAGDPAVFFEQTLEYHPSNPQLHYNLANAYARKNAFELAELEYRTVLALAPDHARCLSNLCSMYIRWGRYQQAADACSQALQIDPSLENAREQLARALDLGTSSVR